MSIRSFPTTTSRRALIDAVVESYVSWREANAAANLAYETWKQCTRTERELSFEDYQAALDREERAAAAYQHLIELAQAA
jgi:hypothetical protein